MNLLWNKSTINKSKRWSIGFIKLNLIHCSEQQTAAYLQPDVVSSTTAYDTIDSPQPNVVYADFEPIQQPTPDVGNSHVYANVPAANNNPEANDGVLYSDLRSKDPHGDLYSQVHKH